ncbi:hypothetical protein ACFQL1_08880 [Halomicroarcula sp. GCM10025709]|uniref:hypothetical protein n=1 Tax=Haloarcula TaxID=2237 RepID=UPI0024C3AC73|nr:hypothetical protein [Halomicroarcula sp. YJ-61-S]
MLPSLQLGVPGGAEIVILLLIFGILLVVPLIVSALIYRDANDRNSSHALAWASGSFFGAFLGGFFGGVVVWALYLVVRDEIGPAGP